MEGSTSFLRKRSKKLLFKEGDIYCIPVQEGCFTLGVVARTHKSGKIFIGYFFSCESDVCPSSDLLPVFDPKAAVQVGLVGGLFLLNGRWQIVGHVKPWIREDWPIPQFVRREEFSNRAWLVSLDDDDLTRVFEKPCDFSISGYETYSLWGAGVAELKLKKILEEQAKLPQTGRDDLHMSITRSAATSS